MKREPCPRCREQGKDRSGNNLINYRDGGKHCFACGWHENPHFTQIFTKKEEIHDEQEKASLPRDWTQSIPTEGWRWLLQYGLSKTYWEPYTGYSPSTNRLVISHGNPVYVSQGRALSVDDVKWITFGDRSNRVDGLGPSVSAEIVLVEDLISAHKVAQVTQSIPLFGTHIHDNVLRKLIQEGKDVVLWLDNDQYPNLPTKCSRIASTTGLGVRYIRTTKDPKDYTVDEIKALVDGNRKEDNP